MISHQQPVGNGPWALAGRGNGLAGDKVVWWRETSARARASTALWSLWLLVIWNGNVVPNSLRDGDAQGSSSRKERCMGIELLAHLVES